MNQKAVLILAAATLALSAGAYVAIFSRAPATDLAQADRPAIPNLADALDSVAKVRVTSTSGTAAVLTRAVSAASPAPAPDAAASTDPKAATGDASPPRWIVENKGGYPARFDFLRDTLVGLSEMKLLERKTSNPANFAKVGVQDVKADGTTAAAQPAITDASTTPATLVELFDEKGVVLGSLIVGKSSGGFGEARRETFVRMPGELQSWLAVGGGDLYSDPMQYVARDILQLPRERIRSVTIRDLSGTGPAPADAPPRLSLLRERPDDAYFILQNIPEGREVKAPSAGDSVVASVSYLSLDDVGRAEDVLKIATYDAPPAPQPTDPASPAPTETAAAPVLAEFRTYDGLLVTLKTFRVNQAWWCTVAATYEEPPAGPPAEKLDAAKAEAQKLSEKLAGWAFAIPDWTAKQISTRTTDLLAPPPDPAQNQVGPVPFSP